MIPFIGTDIHIHKLEKKFLSNKKYFFHPFYHESWVMNVGMKWIEARILFNNIRFLPWEKDWGAIYELLPIKQCFIRLDGHLDNDPSCNYC